MPRDRLTTLLLVETICSEAVDQLRADEKEMDRLVFDLERVVARVQAEVEETMGVAATLYRPAGG